MESWGAGPLRRSSWGMGAPGLSSKADAARSGGPSSSFGREGKRGVPVKVCIAETPST